MSAVLFISHYSSTIKLTVQDSSVIKECVETSCERLQLDFNNNYSLYYNNNELPLDSSIKSLDIISGSKLTLKKSYLSISNSSKNDSIVNIKIQILNSNPNDQAYLRKLSNGLFIHKFNSQLATLNDLLNEFQEILNFNLIDKEPSFQIANKNITNTANQFNKSLKSYGLIKGNQVLRIKLNYKVSQNSNNNQSNLPSLIKSKKFTQSSNIESKNEDKNEKTVQTKKSNNNFNADTSDALNVDDKITFQVFKQSKGSFVQETNDIDDKVYDMTVSQAKKYQKILFDKANRKSDYVEAKLKKEREEREKKQSQTIAQTPKKVSIRIRFPDSNFVQLSFNSNNILKDIFQFLNENILIQNLNFKYNLILPNVFIKQPRNPRTKKLIYDENNLPKILEYKEYLNQDSLIMKIKISSLSNTSVGFELLDNTDKSLVSRNHNYKGPFIKQEYLKEAKDLGFPTGGNANSSNTTGKDSKSESKNDIKHEIKDKLNSYKEKKIPKWLKLAKK
ncbi:Ubx4p ASCRUDRAFT_75835 [Ascoidea rubescens DSM 1968]|uniref:UBX domain-containing protein n=1 Tax=Ascoidea rubescens DSM 1968 TaxID=1344418 RepID=A0A1D2VHN6_9ASCO|nr:hypothetical protein ASCRUDRAFT_75835 [Ascoidea rubescens DSM 1968]ODV61109.1 hypothetical protein ASCRUDRAFT_75835 [Ascoidea rubescens DSM 1968]